MIFDVAGIVSFAHGSLTILGAYIGWSILTRLSGTPAGFVVGVVAPVIAVALDVNQGVLCGAVFSLGAGLAGLGGMLALPDGSANLQIDLRRRDGCSRGRRGECLCRPCVGHIVWRGASETLENDRGLRERYLAL